MPGTIWGVNIAGNGKVAVVAVGDGTIRWYRLQDRKELLALYPHPDKKRRVLWTPSGYYDAASGAEALLGWHKNYGRDEAADFFPLAHFRAGHYRPDVVAKVLETLDEPEALRLANAEAGRTATPVALTRQLPPVVTILAPPDGATVSTADLTIWYTVRSPSKEPVTGVKALAEGRPVATARGLMIAPRDQDARELRVTIPERDVELALLAETPNAVSEPATVRLTWGGRASPDASVLKPKLYVLAVGVSRYDDTRLSDGAKLAAKDARDFAAALQRQQGGLYREVVARVLLDAKKEDILDGLEWIQRETTSKDVAMIFFAGHGVNDRSGNYYFLPANANTNRLKPTGVIFSDILTTVRDLAGKTLVFLDTCRSGNIMGPRRGVADINAVVNELVGAQNGAVVFAASTGRQDSQEKPKWGNGAFTKALVEGLMGKADLMHTGKITVNLLDAYVAERVKKLTNGTQTPTTSKPETVPDFPVALRQ